jgi:hypothetical protein
MIESYKYCIPKFPNIDTNSSGNLSTTSGDLPALLSITPCHSSAAISTDGLQVSAWHTEVWSFLPSIGWLPFDLLCERGFELCGHLHACKEFVRSQNFRQNYVFSLLFQRSRITFTYVQSSNAIFASTLRSY